MNIRLFLEICEEFFELIHPPIIDDITENENDEKNLKDEEKGCQYLDDDNESICGCNLCYTTQLLSLFINPTIYKKLNDNKVD